MKVIEIFKSIDGEGIRTGVPVTFIRLEGCNLRCSYCDTTYSYCQAKYTEMKPIEIVGQCVGTGLKRVTLTGGEPLIHKDVEELVLLLVQYGFEVNIETNGSVDIKDFASKLFRKSSNYNVSSRQLDTIIYTVDFKCYSSKQSAQMYLPNVKFIGTKQVKGLIKFVVGSVDDLNQMREIIEKYKPTCPLYVSPVFGKIEPSEIVEYILDKELTECTVQVQLHKIIWDPNKRGV